MKAKEFVEKASQIMKEDGVLPEIAKGLLDIDPSKATTHTIEADNKFFHVDFTALDLNENKCVINAKRVNNGLLPSEGRFGERYCVKLDNTEAAYILGYYKPRHPLYGWSFINWDVRSYRDHPHIPGKRVYVSSFYAKHELERLIFTMEKEFNTGNILNSYVSDNLSNFKNKLRQLKCPHKAIEALNGDIHKKAGFTYCEALDEGMPRGQYSQVKAHWFKNKEHAIL